MRLEHVTVRLPSELVDELFREGELAGYGMSEAIRRRLEAARTIVHPRFRRPAASQSNFGSSFSSESDVAIQ